MRLIAAIVQPELRNDIQYTIWLDGWHEVSVICVLIKLIG